MHAKSAFLTAAAILLSSTLMTSAAPFEVGEPFPNLALPALEDGRPLSVHDFHGQKLMLHIFASW